MSFEIDEDDYLKHYGILRRSGRYPWGSGGVDEGDTVGRSRDFLGMKEDLRRQGMSDTEIAKAFNMTTTELRATTSIARNQKRAADIAFAQRLKDKGLSNGAIAERMGVAGESSVRALLEPGAQARTDQLTGLSNMLKDQVAEKGYLDVGVGVELDLGVTRTQLDTAISMLKSEDYSLTRVQVDQLGTGNKTTLKVLGPPGKTDKENYRDIVTDLDQIQTIHVNKLDDDVTYAGMKPPLSIGLDRVGINYSKKNAADEEIGGGLADGVIYVRPGVDDVSIKGGQYAQVRIAVNGTHYLKGMAVYKDDLPDGVDLLFNTNKSDTGNKLDAMKPMKDDPADPFGASIKRQILDPKGTKTVSAMNIVNDEGDWANWSKSLASQMLSKQKPSLAQEQLGRKYKSQREELDEIKSLTNPAVKRELLRSFADGADSSAVHLEAAAMDRQATQVILPVKSMKDTEVYAPNFRDGERVALVRYPHGGKFEIPDLVVNNRNPEAAKLLGKNPRDAVGINPKVAEKLSGADFDGDTVLVIPNNAGKIKTQPALDALKGFDPKASYPAYEGMRKMTPKQKQTEMGKVSNLITDMTIKGANDHEIARAVKHSMVVIDAEKHNLNYKQSFLDNGIAQLKYKYQGISEKGNQPKGASTLISRSTSDVRVPKRKQSYGIDEKTGEKVYRETGESYVNAKGKLIIQESRSTQGAEAKNAHSLSSGTPIEMVYADHANRMKGLANEARLAQINTKSIPYSPSANKVYAKEVAQLDRDLTVALRNAPLERKAQLVANSIVKQKRLAEPDMPPDELKKIKGKALVEARIRVGAKKTLVPISDEQWEAIQAGAISNNKLEKILANANLDRVKELATPREATVMTSSRTARAKSLISSGRTPAEVAEILGVSLSTLNSSLKE